MTFDKPHIAVYLNTIPIYKVFTLQQGERQTLIIPSFPNDMYLVRIKSLFFYYDTFNYETFYIYSKC